MIKQIDVVDDIEQTTDEKLEVLRKKINEIIEELQNE